MDFDIVLKLLLAACGICMIYRAAQMKRLHVIPQMLTGRSFPIDRAKNREGFINAMFPLTLTVGIILFITGVMGTLGVFIEHPVIDTVLSLFMLGSLVFYGIFLMNAQKKYLLGLTDNKKNNK